MDKSIAARIVAPVVATVMLSACATQEELAQQAAEEKAAAKTEMLGSVPAGYKLLDGAGVQASFANTTASGVSSRSGSPYKVYYGKDGALGGASGDQYEHTDSGKWRVVEDQACLQWSRWRDGAEYCFWVAQADDKSLKAFRESWGNTFKLTSGDAR
ncbi:MAG: hypothetical protein AAF458_20150 [Pseudomonadota bacterium]